MIKFDKYSKKYGKHIVFDEISFTIDKGCILGLIGKNGAGKTTLLKSIMNLVGYSGNITVNGKRNLNNSNNNILYFSDNLFLYEYLTGEEFIDFTINMYKISTPEIIIKKEKLIELFDLKEYKDSLITEYSLGMKKKTALIPYLLMEPSVLIMDEPVLGVDIKSMVVIKKILKKLSEKGTTVILTTHILEILENMADRLGVLHDNTITFYDKINEFNKTQLEDIYLSYINDEILELIDEII